MEILVIRIAMKAASRIAERASFNAQKKARLAIVVTTLPTAAPRSRGHEWG